MRNLLLAATVALFAFGSGCSSMGGATPDITSMLTKSLGVTENQASGGLGATLDYAKEKLSPGQFDQIAKAIPGADKYMQSAKDLGATSGPIGNVDGLKSAFSRLGMKPEMVDKFVPQVADYAGKAGGESVKKALAGLI